MKKGLFFRLLVVVLACAMLFGLVGFTNWSELAAEDVQQEDTANVPEASEKASEDGDTASEEPKVEEPEGKETPKEDPKEEPEKEPEKELDPGKIAIRVEQPEGGVLKLIEPENYEFREEDGAFVYIFDKGSIEKAIFHTECEKGMTFVGAYFAAEKQEAKQAEEVKEFSETVREFAIPAGEESITVSVLYFGILDVTVDNTNEWINAANNDGGRKVTIKAAGAESAAVMNNKGSYFQAEEVKDKDGVFEAIVTDQIGEKAETYKVAIYNETAGKEPLKADTEVGICKIDTIRPIVTEYSDDQYNRLGFTHYKVHVEETGSGIKDLDVQSRKKISDKWSTVLLSLSTDLESVGNGDYTFKVSELYEARIVVTDAAGNSSIDSSGGGAGFADKSGPIPEFVDITKGTKAGDFWWAGEGAKLKVSATDRSGIRAVDYKVDDGEVVQMTSVGDDKYETAVITSDGTYSVTATDNSKNTTADGSVLKVTVKYDGTKPVINSADFNKNEYVGDNWLKEWLNKVTNGWLFNNAFSFTMNIDESDSGVYAYAYKLVEKEENAPEAAPSIRAAKNDDGSFKTVDGWTFVAANVDNKITVTETGEFTGSVYVYVWDKAENVSGVQVGEDAIITNLATDNDDDTSRDEPNFNPQLTVMASYEVNGEDVAYGGAWTQQVDFKIGFTVPEGVENTFLKAHYNDEYHEIKFDANTVDYSIGGVDNNHVAVNGTVTFTLCYDVVVYGDNPDTADVVETDFELSRETMTNTTDVINVHIQNFLNAATVVTKVKGAENGETVVAGDVYGWYNAQNNVLELAKIVGCAGSTAPYATHYTVKYLSNQDYVSGKRIKDAEVKLDGKIGTFEGAEADNIDIHKTLKKNPEIYYPGIYYVEVWSEDAAGNTADNENPAVYTFKIDEAMPTITAIFTNSESETYENFAGSYFNTQRTIQVRVSDTSFTGDEEIDNIKSFANSVKYTDVKGNEAKELQKTLTWDYENNEWNMEYVFGIKDGGKTADATDGDSYKLTVSATDNAGNTVYTDEDGVLYYLNGNDKSIISDNCYFEFDGTTKELAKIFTMDQTKPVVTVSFDNNEAKNNRYFKAARTATVTIVEHNLGFADGTIYFAKLDIQGNTDGGNLVDGWKLIDKDTYQKKFVFAAKDADCKFDIEITDLAGNKNADVIYSAGTVAPNDFVIDLTNPDLNTTGTQTGPYNENCTPGFNGDDKNISSADGSAEYTVRLTRCVREHKNEDVTDRFASGAVSLEASNISAMYANIPDDAANDGIYTLTVSVTDLAGNTTETSTTFTVNRHGSFYIFSDDLADLVNAKFVQKADGKYSVTEYNASPLVEGSVKIEIYRDDQLVNTLTPALGAGVIGGSGLYEYTYGLDAKNFAEDGRYKIVLSSEDEATNVSENTKLDDADIQFVVDTVAPEIVIINGLEKARVNAEELEFTANVTDTYGLASVEIFVDGELAKAFVDQSVYDALKAKGENMSVYEILTNSVDIMAAYTLLESNAKQSIEIKVTDMAGNVLSTEDEGFEPVYDFHDSVLVSSNFFARYIHNPLALVGTGVVIAGAVWFFLPKKRNEEKTVA